MFDENELKLPEFKNSFWERFDNLSLVEKKKFWYYGSDMAMIFFLNKYWKAIKAENYENIERSSNR